MNNNSMFLEEHWLSKEKAFNPWGVFAQLGEAYRAEGVCLTRAYLLEQVGIIEEVLKTKFYDQFTTGGKSVCHAGEFLRSTVLLPLLASPNFVEGATSDRAMIASTLAGIQAVVYGKRKRGKGVGQSQVFGGGITAPQVEEQVVSKGKGKSHKVA